jgi:hypothetical protein
MVIRNPTPPPRTPVIKRCFAIVHAVAGSEWWNVTLYRIGVTFFVTDNPLKNNTCNNVTHVTPL